MMKIKYCILPIIASALFLNAQNEGNERGQLRKAAIMQENGLARYYIFEDVKDSRSLIKELRGSGADLGYVAYRDGEKEIDDLKVTEGRAEGKRAVRLDSGWYQGPVFDIKDKQFTVSVWFRRQGAGTLKSVSHADEGAIISVGGWESGWRIATVYDEYNTLRFCLGRHGGCEKVMSDMPVADKAWHHLAAVWDGKEMFLYLNGTLVGRKAYSGGYVPAGESEHLRIGNAGDGTGSVILDIEEVAIYNRVLSRREIQYLKSGVTNLAGNILKTADKNLLKGEYETARNEYNKLKEMKPVEYGKEIGLFNIAESYRLEKKYIEAHKTYSEILEIPDLTTNYRVYCLFKQAEVYIEQNNYKSARSLYSEILKTKAAAENHIFKAGLSIGDSYRQERKYNQAREIYERLLKEQDRSEYPHENRRLEIVDRLESIEGLKDGQAEKSLREKRAELLNMPKYAIYVSLNGDDNNDGSKSKPFKTLQRAQEEVRIIKRDKGLPEGGISVYLRGGKYFITGGVKFNGEDSGGEGSPLVYRSYPGEEVRIIGGKQIAKFKLPDDQNAVKRMPEEAKGKVLVADLKEAGITSYGNLVNRGHSYNFINPSAMELFCDTVPMTLARWPDDEWAIVSDLVTPGGDGGSGDYAFQKGRFRYSGDRPGRWSDEKNIWAVGYFMQPWDKIHTQVIEINTDKRIVTLAPDIRHSRGYPSYDMPVRKGMPYFFYNILSEISKPGEFYVDRERGLLYFYPPGDIGGSEIIVSTLDGPIIGMKSVSNMVVYGLTLEATRHNGITIDGCKNSLVAGCTIRNTGNLGIIVEGGLNIGIAGCDIYDTGEGGIQINGGSWPDILPSGHFVENNHIYRYNRFSHGGGKFAVFGSGVGIRISHNLVSDAPYAGIMFEGNNNVVEYNEIYDIMYEGKDGGAIYTYGAPRSLMNRGNIIRHNFIHHITEHTSVVPYDNPGVVAIYIDALNAGLTIVGNVIYRCTGTSIFTHGADSRVDDNIFADNRLSIHQGNRSYLLREPHRIKFWKDSFLDMISYRQPPWVSRYPQMRDILRKEEHKNLGWPKNVSIQRNINVAGQFIRITNDLYEGNVIKDNLDGIDPFFADDEGLDFSLRPGSPVYAVSSFEGENGIRKGLYEDSLRASWPPKRRPHGKYYRPEKLEILPPDRGKKQPAPEPESAPGPVYTVSRKTGQVKIDGRLEKEEWNGADRESAMVIEQNVGGDSPGDRSWAWIRYDDKYLYVAVENGPNPFREGMPESQRKLSRLFNELAVEGIYGPATWWWQQNVDTGPVYILWGYSDGRFEVKNNFGMALKTVKNIEESIEYRVSMIDGETGHWTAEWRIPFSSLNIREIPVSMGFNLGAPKRGGWIAWAPTGWLLDRAGKLVFDR